MKRQEIMLLLISSFTLIVAWIVFNILHSATSSTISTSLSVNIAPITPAFDTKTIADLKKRIVVVPVYSLSTRIVEESISTKSSEINNQEGLLSATQGGQLK